MVEPDLEGRTSKGTSPTVCCCLLLWVHGRYSLTLRCMPGPFGRLAAASDGAQTNLHHAGLMCVATLTATLRCSLNPRIRQKISRPCFRYRKMSVHGWHNTCQREPKGYNSALVSLSSSSSRRIVPAWFCQKKCFRCNEPICRQGNLFNGAITLGQTYTLMCIDAVTYQ